MMRTNAVCAEIFKTLSKLEDTDVHAVLSGLASALSALTINAGYNEEESVEAYRNTFRFIQAQLIEDEGGKIH